MFLNVLLDVILILILVGGSYYGYTRGLFRILARPMRFILCLLLSLSLCRVVGEAIIAPLIEAPITNYISEFMLERCVGLSSGAAVEKIPTLMRVAAAAFNVTLDTTAETVGEAVEGIVLSVATPLVSMIATAASFLLLLVISRIAFKFIVDIADGIFNFGIIGSINRFFGVVLSCAFAFFAAWLFAAFTDFLFRTALFDGSELLRDFEGGPIFRFFMSFSPIRLLLSF